MRRDRLLEAAMGKLEGPTSSILLTRDEVLLIIDQTNKLVSSRSGSDNCAQSGSHKEGDSVDKVSTSSPFWDEVYRETEQLEPNSVLSISELSMMVFGFLKAYVQEGSLAVRSSESLCRDGERQAKENEGEQVARESTCGTSSTGEDGCPAQLKKFSSSSNVASQVENGSNQGEQSQNIKTENWSETESPFPRGALTQSAVLWQGEPEQRCFWRPSQEIPGSESDVPWSPVSNRLEKGAVNRISEEEGVESPHVDAAALLKSLGAETEDACKQSSA